MIQTQETEEAALTAAMCVMEMDQWPAVSVPVPICLAANLTVCRIGWYDPRETKQSEASKRTKNN